MEKFKNFCLFISSFAPLYFLIIVKELVEIANGNLSFNVTNSIMLSLNLLLIAFGILGVCLTYKDRYKAIEVIDSKNVTCQNFLGYFPLFVLFALAFQLEFVSMAVVYVLILVMIGVVYLKNNLTYINPFLNIIGFSTYQITFLKGEEEKKLYVFSFSNLENRTYLSNGFFIKPLKQKKNKKTNR